MALTLITAWKCLSRSAIAGLRTPVAALLMRMSTPPQVSRRVSLISVVAADSRRLARMASASLPAASMAAVTASRPA